MVGILGAVGAGALGGAGINIVISAVDKFSKTFGTASASLLKLGAGLTAVGVAGAFAVSGLVKMAGQFEQTQIAFTTMLGSAKEADKLLKELADFASKTPFTITGIEANAKQLLAMGIEVEDLLPTLKTLGDISSGLNVPLERLALNFGQVAVQGKLTGRELRDFSVAGVPLIAELAKNLNIAESEVKEMVTAGDIGFDKVEKAFKTMTSAGGKFFDLMDKQSKTFLGQVSNIQDEFIKLARIMGEIFLPIAIKVAGGVSVIIEFMGEHPKITRFTAVVLGLTTVVALLLGPLIILGVLLPSLVAGFGLMTTAFFVLTGAVSQFGISLAIALGPLGLIAVAAGLLVGLLISVTNTSDEATDSMSEFSNSMTLAEREAEKLNATLRQSVEIMERLFAVEEQNRRILKQAAVTRTDLPGPGPRVTAFGLTGARDRPISELSIPELQNAFGNIPIQQTGIVRSNTTIVVELDGEVISRVLSNELNNKMSI